MVVRLEWMPKVSVTVSLHSLAFSVPIFNGTNFSCWIEQIQFHLGVLDLDLALRIDKPVAITETSRNNIKSTLPQLENVKEYLKAVENRFHSANKSLAGRLMAKLTAMKFDGSRGMNEHVLDMTNLAA
ncbi:uncharacterized protein LOC131151532 [Malania oleifera]|uniref:uncharacterized protein LOC131151532 n=1 Tax=Malania oleifera TaxID=397392 RepID=UPI0025ADCC97|nr:uncharacterized protein LOC131151532 [Malania oleifera]